MANIGHEIVLSEIRQNSRSLILRLLWSLGNAFFAFIFGSLLFGPKNLILNVLAYWYYLLVFQIKQLPIIGVTKLDIHHVAFFYSKMMGGVWFWKYALIFSSFVFVASFVYFTVQFFKKGQRAYLENIMRGNQLLTPKVHNKVMRSEYKKAPPFEMGKSLILGQEQILVPESLQYLHFAFVGASGCGKSTAIEEIITHAQKQNEKAFIVDLNGAFYAKFGKPEDHILSLRDPRTRAWDFWSENGVAPENMAAAMIEATGESNSYFWKGARAVLASLLRHTSSCAELWDDFRKSTNDIRKKLEDSGELSQRVIGNGDGDQADGILGSTVLDFSFLKELNQWNDIKEEKLSITDWVNNNRDKSWVYLIVSDNDIEITKPLLRVWFDLACLAALKRNPNHHENIHTWLIIDELKSVGQLPSLPAILDKGRKYQTSVVLGFQAISQVQKIYGELDAKSILQGIQNQFYFRMSEIGSAKYASDALGEQELEQVNVGMSFGQKKDSDRGSLNTTTTCKKVVLPDEMRNLKTLQCFVKLCHHQPFKMEFKITKKPQINEPAQSKINDNYRIVKYDKKGFSQEKTSENEDQKKRSEALPWRKSNRVKP